MINIWVKLRNSESEAQPDWQLAQITLDAIAEGKLLLGKADHSGLLALNNYWVH